MRTVHLLMLLLVGEHKRCWILFDKILYKHNLAITNIWNRKNHFVGSMSKSLFSLCLHSYVLCSSGTLELVGWGSGERNKQQGGSWYEAGTHFMALDVSGKIPVPNTMATTTFGDSVAFSICVVFILNGMCFCCIWLTIPFWSWLLCLSKY